MHKGFEWRLPASHRQVLRQPLSKNPQTRVTEKDVSFQKEGGQAEGSAHHSKPHQSPTSWQCNNVTADWKWQRSQILPETYIAIITMGHLRRKITLTIFWKGHMGQGESPGWCPELAFGQRNQLDSTWARPQREWQKCGAGGLRSKRY